MERLLIGQISPAGCSCVPRRFVAVKTLVIFVEKCDSHAPELECAHGPFELSAGYGYREHVLEKVDLGHGIS